MAAQAPVPGCGRHHGAGFVYLCLDCNEELLCPRCVVDIHKFHNFVIIEDFVSEKRAELKQYTDKVSLIDNPSLQGDLTAAGEKIEENRRRFKQMIENIKDQAQKMKLEIDKCVEKLIKLCCAQEKCNEDMLNSYKCALETLRYQNITRIEEYQQIQNSGTHLEVIQKAKEARCILETPLVPGEIKTVQYQPGSVSICQLENILGFVTVGEPDQEYHPVNKSTFVTEFKHKSPVSTCRTTQGNAWLSCWEDDEIYKVDQQGQIMETIQCNVRVGRMTTSPTTGRVWFCCIEDKTVREVMDHNTIETRFTTDSEPMSLCITTNENVVIGMQGKIVMYTTDGQEIESAGADGPCRQEAVVPWHMSLSTHTGDVAVTDSEGISYDDYMAGRAVNKQPHIKMMDKHLNERFRYPRRDNSCVIIKENKFSEDTDLALFFPCDVCFEPTGNILVAEAVTKSILQIDGGQGEYIQTIHRCDIEPWSISLQTDVTLWVGLNYKKVKVLKYQIQSNCFTFH